MNQENNMVFAWKLDPPGRQDAQEEDVGEEGHVGEHQDGVEAGLRDEISIVFKNNNIFLEPTNFDLAIPTQIIGKWKILPNKGWWWPWQRKEQWRKKTLEKRLGGTSW